jgi:hypothetical protein
MALKPSSPPTGRSTGPRTAEGRKRSAQNSLRHGLTAQAPEHGAIAAQVEAWTQGTRSQQPATQDFAILAEARLQISRVRAHQADILEQLCALRSPEPHEGSDTSNVGKRSDLVLAFVRSLRYRAEAEARRRKALRAVADTLAEQNQRETQYGAR